MATSGSIDWNLNRNQIILAAFRKVGAFATGETPDADSVNAASESLNALVKHYETQGIHLWTETEGTLWLQSNQYNYGLGGGATDHATLASDYTMTTLSANAADGATTLTVTSTSGFGNNFYVGVMLDDGSMFWSQQNGAAAGFVITLDDALTDSAAAGNLVFVYETQLERPLRIVGARKVQWNATESYQIETPMNPMLARLDYRALPNKAATGVPTQIFYDPQLVTGQVWVWPAPQNAVYGVNFTFYRTIQDFDAAANTSDLPVEWMRTLIWNLALDLAPEYDLSGKRFALIEKVAMQSLDEVRGWDREPESIYAGVAFDQRGGN